MKKIFLSFCLAILFGVSFAQTREIIWADEFDYEGLPNPEKWGYDVGGGGWGNNELQYYTKDRLQNARVEGGNLIIEAIHEFYGGNVYSSARLITKNKGDWKYGYFEMRAILPSGRGTWPAFWMLPTDWEYGGWPNSGEIDIMEHVGYDPPLVHGTVHTKLHNGGNGTQVGNSISVPACESEFHIYGCEWTETQIKMYVDNQLYFTFNNQNFWENWPFDKRFHILLNIAVGGNWGGVEGVDANAFPAKFIIDYVRVYAPGTSPTGLNENNADKIIVYPNPTEANFFVDLGEYNSASPLDISIYNVLGQKINNMLIEPNQQLTKLEMPGQSGSTYFYVIKNESGILKKGGIIKN